MAKGEKLRHAVIEFVVTKTYDLVATLCDNLRWRLASRQCALQVALQVVAGIDQGDVGFAIFFALVRSIINQCGIAQFGFGISQQTMDVIGVQDDDVVGRDACRATSCVSRITGRQRSQVVCERARRP